MIGTSLAEWIFIRLSVACFRYAPLLYIGIFLVIRFLFCDSQLLGWPYLLLCSLLAAEALFYITVQRPYARRLGQAAVHPEPLSSQQRRILFDRCISNVPDHQLYLRWWFLGAIIDDICRDNLREFLLWAFFDATEQDVRHDDSIQQELDEYIDIIEGQLGRRLSLGRGEAKCLRLTLDGITSTYRGLLWYSIVFLVDQLTHLAMLSHGFQFYARSPSVALRTIPPRPQELIALRRSPVSDLSYWYYPYCRTNGELPIVFFHGIGIGLWTYIRFVADLRAAKTRGVIAIELLPISFRLTAPPPDKLRFLLQMVTILGHHQGWDKFAIASHSYGSVLATHMLRSPALGHRVASIVLIDPVTIMLHLPSVAYNFTRRYPSKANEWQLWYFASTDPGVAHCLGRHFFWRENIIWKDELVSSGRRAAVCLAGRDLIVDVAEVLQYLKSNDQDSTIEVLVFPHLDHAQIFDDPSARRRALDLVSSHCNSGA
ncbi:hypothetical protein RJ55_05134 [Drechmeria coniospora]|nr:hypothetical protein RJ55_05134 [Drechmeria coniospora]